MTAFTVIIPTRERCDTLRSTLQTCVTQDYDKLTILVSDNASQDTTHEVVSSFKDPRIRYVRAANRLSMASNWELALSHVDDGYVLVVGDDDGLLPHAIADLAVILDETRCEAIAWTQADYTWPTCKGGKIPNRLKFVLSRKHRVRDAREDLAEVLAYRRSFKQLPSLYWGAVHRSVLRRATPSSGRFFNCVNPDVYSCIASTSTVDRFVVSDGPYSLKGLSSHSTGMSFVAGETGNSSKVGTFWKEVDLPVHPKVAMVPASTIYLTEAYEQARDHVPNVQLPAPDYAALFVAAMQEMNKRDRGGVQTGSRRRARHGQAARSRGGGEAGDRRLAIRRESSPRVPARRQRPAQHDHDRCDRLQGQGRRCGRAALF